ncbi:MAG TPA: Gfo/Idh/MocA family oxidoreductase [Candidatus Sulfotelmatobacter sp.]|jgi:predicted dehydrogenase/threonine dehydrogenase-like Zn-dependent dehydrogenase
MKQLLRKGLSTIVVDEVPDPVVAPHHVIVRPHYSLISSGTETASIHRGGALGAVAENPSYIGKILDVMRNEGPLRTTREVLAKFSEYAVLGYSGAGVIIQKHSNVLDLEVGDHVAYGGEGTGHAEAILVGQNLVARIPDNVAFEHACFTTLGSIALNAVRIANISLGEKVAVIGLGLVGQLIAQLARLQGGFVVATDLKPDRVALARQLGADSALLGGGQFSQQVSSITGGIGVDCAIIAAAAKSDAPCRVAVEICRDRGRIVDVGAVELNFPWYESYLKEIQVFMARAYGPGSYDSTYEKQGRDYPLPYVRWTEKRNMEEFLRLAAQGRLQIEGLTTHRFPLEDAPRAYDVIMDSTQNSLAVLLKYPAADVANAVAAAPPAGRIEVNRSDAGGSEFGVALVGAGNLARWVHLPNLKKTPGARLRAIQSGSGSRAKSYALRFGAEYCTSDYGEILSNPAVQVVVIVSRNQQHAAQALAALRAGKHVFVEKPMALTEEECRELAQAVQESGRQLTVGFNRRYAPSYISLKQQIAKRTAPAVLNCRVNSPGISGSYWMADPVIGGAILGEACHFVDLMYWLLESEPVEVFASSLPTGAKDPIGQNNLVASFSFADGSIANLTYCTVGSRTSGGERVEAFASGVGASAENFRESVVRAGLVRKRTSWFAEKGYDAQMQAFFAALRKGKPADINVRDGVRATLGCLRMLQSAREHSPCALDLDRFLAAPEP